MGGGVKVADMRRVYRQSRSEGIVCGLSVVLFALVFALLLVVAWSDESVRSPWALTGLAVCVPGTMFVISLWGLVASVRGRLEIDDDLIVQTGAFSTRSVCLSGLTAIHWMPRSVTLVGAAGRMRIWLNFAARHDHLELVRCIRNALPTDKQTGWEWFFCRSIVPLLRCKLLPGPGDVVIKRRRWDVIFAIALVLAAAVAWFSWHVTGQARLFVIPLFLLPIWLPVRWSTPRRGMIVRSSANKDDGSRTFLIQWLCAFLLAGTGMVVNAVYADSVQGLNVVLIAGSILLMALLLLAAHQQDRRMQSHREREHAEVVAQCDWITDWPHEIEFERERGVDEST